MRFRYLLSCKLPGHIGELARCCDCCGALDRFEDLFVGKAIFLAASTCPVVHGRQPFRSLTARLISSTVCSSSPVPCKSMGS